MGIWNERLRRLLISAGVTGIALTGCNDSSGDLKPGADAGPNADVRSVPLDSSGNDAKSDVVNFDQSFSEAATTKALDGQSVPPDLTVAGKRTGSCVREWKSSGPKLN